MRRFPVLVAAALLWALAVPSAAQPPSLVGAEADSSREGPKTIEAALHYVATNASGSATFVLECDADAVGDPPLAAVSTGVSCWLANKGGRLQSAMAYPGPAAVAANQGPLAFEVPSEVCMQVVVHWSDNSTSSKTFCW